MATPTASSSEELGQYARKIRGEWSMEPAAALDRIVPELGGDKYKGQVCKGNQSEQQSLNMRPERVKAWRLVHTAVVVRDMHSQP